MKSSSSTGRKKKKRTEPSIIVVSTDATKIVRRVSKKTLSKETRGKWRQNLEKSGKSWNRYPTKSPEKNREPQIEKNGKRLEFWKRLGNHEIVGIWNPRKSTRRILKRHMENSILEVTRPSWISVITQKYKEKPRKTQTENFDLPVWWLRKYERMWKS